MSLVIIVLSGLYDIDKLEFQNTREDYLELRQEANDLREYSNAKLDRVTRYLGFLADRARKLGTGKFFIC